MKEKDITFGNYSPEFKPTPLSSTGDTPVDFYSWGENPSGGLITRKQQMDAKLEKAFDSIEISEDPTTPETDYVLKVLGKDAGRLVMPIDSIINNAYYDKQTQELVLVISMGDTEKEIRINVKELVDDYKGDDATISIDENNVISIKKEVMDKFTDLYKSISDETAEREAADVTLQGAIDAEAATRELADEALQGAVDTEAATREAKDTELQGNIDAEATARTSADEALQEAIDAETEGRTAADEVLQAAIDAEIAARTSADETLQGAIDSEVAAREAADVALQGAIDTEIATRTSEDAKLQQAIDTEVATREAKDTELQGNIDAEIEARTSADEALQGAIDSEVATRTSEDTKLQEAINAEATSREAKDTELQGNIDAEATARTSADEALQEAINAEVATRTSEDAKLQEAINAESAARESVKEALQGAIDTEATTRETKDTKLQESIDAESAAREAKDTEFQGVINTEVTTREAKDTELQAAINAEATARETKDIEFQGVINAEATAREAKDTEFQGVIDAEIAARTSADTNLQNAINKEIEDREAADVTLQNSIATTLSDSKSYTDSEIAKEVARAEEAENTLKDSKADKEHTHQISEVETLQTVLDTKLTLDGVKAIINEQIYKLFKTVVVDTADFNTADTTNPNESYALVGDGETISMTQSKSFIGKSVKLGNIDLSSESSTKSVLNIVANDSELDNLTLSGTWSRSVGGNTMISLNNAQNVTVSDVEVSRTGGYNAVEIGLDGKGTTKSVVIDGLEISSSLSNNGINIFSFEDNANVIIKNCHFTEVSNPIRISNMTYAKNVNITIQDCTFDTWESNTPAYAGLILLQDHTSTSTEVFNEKNPFATFNITIDNVTGPYGKIASGQTMEEICASQNAEKQLVYMYVDKATPTLIPYTSDKYPTITIK